MLEMEKRAERENAEMVILVYICLQYSFYKYICLVRNIHLIVTI